MKKIEKSEDQIIFIAEIEETIANSIRRYISQIPILAVDEVEILKNDSALYDESIAHRIGLIPLKTEKGVGKKEGKLKLETKGEKTVYSEDLKGSLDIVYKKIPITTLSNGQELCLTAFVKEGKGSQHSKFSPGIMFYREIAWITLDKDIHDEIKKTCPEANIKEKGDKILIIDDQKKEVADICEQIAMEKGKKPEIETKNSLMITIESFGQISPEEIFKKSISVLKKDLEVFSKEINKS